MHKDDQAWVKKQIMRLNTPKMRQEVLAKYKDVYWQAFDNEPLRHRKEGKARFAANNRLRIYVQKLTCNTK